VTALFPYQSLAADKIVTASKVVYNAFEAGLGKSAIALEVAQCRNARRVLIACPLSVAYAWTREIRRFWPNAPPATVIRSQKDAKALARDGVFIVTYGLLSRSKLLIAAIKAASPMDFSILDEAHFLKNAHSNRTKALLAELRQNLGRVHPMSATPTPNHAGELWAILRAFRPDLIPSLKIPGEPMREAEFIERYCETKTITVRVNGRQRQQEIIVGSKNVEELRTRLKGFFLRETKARVLKELPPLRFDVLPVAVADPDSFKTVGQLLADGVRDDQVLAEASGMANATLYAELGLAKAPMVAEYVSDILDGGAVQVVVWAVHHAVIDLLVERLSDYGVSRLDGRINSAMRAHAIDRFLTGGSRVFVGQIQAGGTGLTLIGGKQPCFDVVFAETSFSPSDNWQAACRVHRIGQHDAVLARFASAAGTYDDRIQEILARKAKDFTELFDREGTEPGVKELCQ
jgi:SWI/SNF-related matrix-associated actin-dependent regulator 1 of chromatin subfamily A